jgi:PAS domain S-box-containing protein
MTTATPTRDDVLEEVDALWPPGTPVTTPEVAEEFDCTKRTIYNRLDALVEDGRLQTKKVGASSRVWWRPVDMAPHYCETMSGREQVRAHPVFDSELVGVIVWGADPTSNDAADLVIEDANDAFLEMAGLEYEDALDTSWRELTPETYYSDSERNTESVKATGSGAPYEKQYYHADDSRWWGLFELQPLNDDKFVEFVVDVTEREEAQQELRESEARLSEVLSQFPLGVGVLDADGTYELANERLEEILDGTVLPSKHPEKQREWFATDDNGEPLPPDQWPGARALRGEVVSPGVEFRLDRDDETRWFDVSTAPFEGPGERSKAIGVVHEITERKQREERERFLLALSDAIRPLSDPVEIQHEAARVLGERLDANRAHYAEVDDDEDTFRIRADHYREGLPSVAGEYQLSEFGEYTAETLRAGENLVLHDTHAAPELSDEGRDADAAVEDYARAAVPFFKDGRLEAFFSVDSAEPREWTDTEIELIGETVGRTWEAVERARAEEEFREMTAALERLTRAGQELIDATPETIRDRTADVVLSILDVEYAALRRYDETAGELEAHASESFSDVVADGIRLPRDLSEQAWQTFISDTVDVDNDIDIPEDDADDGRESSSVRSRMLVPLGRHGVICAASTQANAFDDQTIDLAETVATTVETAWDRAESEQELAQQNEEFIHLDRLNTLLRGVDQALVATETVERIDDAVCERIAESELYEFAWIGDYDAETGGVEPRAWAGVDSAYLDDFETRGSDPSVDESPFTTALRTGELQVIADVATDPRAVPWREETLERGGRSCLCIPLTYDDSVYGVLAVYGGTPHQEARDTEVLAELGRTIGHAIHAVETRDSLRTDTAYELTLESSDAETPLCRLSRTSGCVIEFEGQVPGADGLTTVFFTASGIDPDEFVAASEGSIAIDDLTRLDERDDGVLYKVRLVEPTLAGLFIEEGASVHSLSIDAGTATAVLDLPDTTEVSTFLTAVRTSVPDLELLTRRSRTRSLETDLTLRTTFEERLTPRQREVLQLAYRSGFFESPRLQTGKELAEALSLAQSTFNYHLRGAQRTLLELLFEPAEATN